MGSYSRHRYNSLIEGTLFHAYKDCDTTTFILASLECLSWCNGGVPTIESLINKIGSDCVSFIESFVVFMYDRHKRRLIFCTKAKVI